MDNYFKMKINKDFEINSSMYQSKYYLDALDDFESRFRTPAIKIGLQNIGIRPGTSLNFMKLIVLFILNQAIKNGLEKIGKKIEENVWIFFFFLINF